jgi:uncharacterized protein YjiS (DUF1127 family)
VEDISTIHGARRTAHAGYAVIEAVAAMAADAAQAVWRWTSEVIRARRMAAVRREMLGMSDHFLRDIGLDRSQVDRMFR